MTFRSFTVTDWVASVRAYRAVLVERARCEQLCIEMLRQTSNTQSILAVEQLRRSIRAGLPTLPPWEKL